MNRRMLFGWIAAFALIPLNVARALGGGAKVQPKMNRIRVVNLTGYGTAHYPGRIICTPPSSSAGNFSYRAHEFSGDGINWFVRDAWNPDLWLKVRR